MVSLKKASSMWNFYYSHYFRTDIDYSFLDMKTVSGLNFGQSLLLKLTLIRKFSFNIAYIQKLQCKIKTRSKKLSQFYHNVALQVTLHHRIALFPLCKIWVREFRFRMEHKSTTSNVVNQTRPEMRLKTLLIHAFESSLNSI